MPTLPVEVIRSLSAKLPPSALVSNTKSPPASLVHSTAQATRALTVFDDPALKSIVPIVAPSDILVEVFEMVN